MLGGGLLDGREGGDKEAERDNGLRDRRYSAVADITKEKESTHSMPAKGEGGFEAGRGPEYSGRSISAHETHCTAKGNGMSGTPAQ